MPKIDHTQTFRMSSSTTASDLTAWLRNVPVTAKITVGTTTEDWGYADTSTLTATWTTEGHNDRW